MSELGAYKRAKAENDERFQIERDEARAEAERLRQLLQEERGAIAEWVAAKMGLQDRCPACDDGASGVDCICVDHIQRLTAAESALVARIDVGKA